MQSDESIGYQRHHWGCKDWFERTKVKNFGGMVPLDKREHHITTHSFVDPGL